MSSTTILVILGVAVVIGLYILALTKTTIIEYYPPGSNIVYKCKILSRERVGSSPKVTLIVELNTNGGVFLGIFKTTVPAKVKSFELKTNPRNWYLMDIFRNEYPLSILEIGMSN